MKNKEISIINENDKLILFKATKDKKKLSIEEKLVIIELLRCSQRELNGVLVPQFARWESLLDISRENLRYWWRKRDEIEQQAEVMITHIPRAVGIRFNLMMFMLTDSLLKKLKNEDDPFDDMSNRDKINLLRTLVPYSRLLVGKSTENIAVKYEPVIPKTK